MSDNIEIEIGPKKEFFSWLPNYLVNDPNFSADALACALYLNGKSAGWRARPFDIRKRFGWGRHTWLKVAKELKDYNLLHEKKIAEGTILWFAFPEVGMAANSKESIDPPSDFRTVRKPTVGKSNPLDNKDNTNKDLINNKDNALSENDISLIFDKLWEIYPLKKSKQQALEAFYKILKGKGRGEAENVAKTIWLALGACIDEHQAKLELQLQGADIWVPGLPYLSTWLNKRRWVDEYQSPEEILKGSKRKKSFGVDLASREARLRQEGFIT